VTASVEPISAPRLGELEDFLAVAREEMESKRSKRLAFNLDLCDMSVTEFAVAAAENPSGTLFFPILLIENIITGFGIFNEMNMPIISDGMVSFEPYTFIWALYKSPFVVISGKRSSTSGRANKLFLDYVDSWARSRGHKRMVGNCKPGFKTRAARLWGFELSHLVLERKIGD